MVSNYTTEITKSEIKEAIRLTAALISLTTNIVPSKSNSNMCKNALVLRILMIPLIRFNSNIVLESRGNLLIKKYSNSSNYMLLSKDFVISKTTKLFGQKLQIIGRSCKISEKVNGSSYPTGNFLFEHLAFEFEGPLELNETCLINGSLITETWNFNNTLNKEVSDVGKEGRIPLEEWRRSIS